MPVLSATLSGDLVPAMASRRSDAALRSIADRAAFASLGARRVQLRAGDVLYRAGDRSEIVYLMIGGWAYRFRMLADAKRQVIDYVRPGDLVGFDMIRPQAHGVAARTASEFLGVSREQFAHLLQRAPPAGRSDHAILGADAALAPSPIRTEHQTHLVGLTA